jgi:putative restriction endonuclease
VFLEKNGAHALGEMRRRIAKYRRVPESPEDFKIGCILLEQPFFLPRDLWIPVPRDWSPHIVQGKTYDDSTQEGKHLFDQVLQQIPLASAAGQDLLADAPPRYGKPVLSLPRLGQGSFRVIVTDAYERRCSVTGERTLPALDAAHIRRYRDGGPHDPRNGLLLRTDLHRLFDKGYLTVTPDLRVEVSRRIKEEFENGRDYYALHGHQLRPPRFAEMSPDPKFLESHNENVFRG